MIAVIVQARTGSNRFPRKIYADINGKDTLRRVLEGVSSAELPHKIILAMPEYDEKEFKERCRAGEFEYLDAQRFRTYFGSGDDLIDRYAQAARKFQVDLIVRVTADCPFIQGHIIDEMLCEYLKNGYNGFMGNNELVSDNWYPDGTDVEIFPYWLLMETHQLAVNPSDREHVTPFMYRRGTEYNIYPFRNQRPNSMITTRIEHFSFDTDKDYKLMQRIAKEYDQHHDLDKALKSI